MLRLVSSCRDVKLAQFIYLACCASNTVTYENSWKLKPAAVEVNEVRSIFYKPIVHAQKKWNQLLAATWKSNLQKLRFGYWTWTACTQEPNPPNRMGLCTFRFSVAMGGCISGYCSTVVAIRTAQRVCFPVSDGKIPDSVYWSTLRDHHEWLRKLHPSPTSQKASP